MDAWVVVDNHFADFSAGFGSIDGDKAVHLTVETDLVENLSAVSFERTAIIVQVHTGYCGDKPIRSFGGDCTCQFVILAVFSPAADHIIAFVKFFQQ